MADLKTATTGYPSAVDTYTEWADNTDNVVAESVNNALSAIIAIEGELGASVKGSSSTVAARLAVCLAQNGALQSGTGFPVSPTPTGGQLFVRADFSPWRLYMYDGTTAQWVRIESVTDHGVLTGLSDDDHTQYVHNTTARTVSANHTFSGNPTFSGTPVFSGNPTLSGTPSFSHATGVSPFTITSTTKVTNLNADLLDDLNTATAATASTVAARDSNGDLTARVLISGVATGTAPLTVSSTTNVPNLNASSVSGKAPGAASGLATLDSNSRVVEPSNSITDGTVTLKPKIIEIGDWDMDATALVSIAHGLTRLNIRSIDVLIRDDLSVFDTTYPLNIEDSSSLGGWFFADETYVRLNRANGGYFDSTSFDSTSYNRGWITIWYAV